MAYNKEYYDNHKEQIKKIRDKYRNNPQNREKINKQQREKYQNLSDEEKKKIMERVKEWRVLNEDKSRIQYRINLKKRQLKRYTEQYKELDHRKFMLNMVDSWTNEDRAYNNELSNKMKEIREKIDNKNKEIELLKIERKNYNG